MIVFNIFLVGSSHFFFFIFLLSRLYSFPVWSHQWLSHIFRHTSYELFVSYSSPFTQSLPPFSVSCIPPSFVFPISFVFDLSDINKVCQGLMLVLPKLLILNVSVLFGCTVLYLDIKEYIWSRREKCVYMKWEFLCSSLHNTMGTENGTRHFKRYRISNTLNFHLLFVQFQSTLKVHVLTNGWSRSLMSHYAAPSTVQYSTVLYTQIKEGVLLQYQHTASRKKKKDNWHKCLVVSSHFCSIVKLKKVH